MRCAALIGGNGLAFRDRSGLKVDQLLGQLVAAKLHSIGSMLRFGAALPWFALAPLQSRGLPICWWPTQLPRRRLAPAAQLLGFANGL
jgi:hypothetical protein